MTVEVLRNRAARDFVVDSVAALAKGRSLPDPEPDKHDGWVDCAVESGLAPVLAHQRRVEGKDDICALSAAMRTAAMSHLLRLADLRAVRAALDAAGVRWLVFKGPAVAELAYPSPGTRTYNDLDILIHPGDFANGLAALLEGPAQLIDQNWSLISAREQGEISLVVGRTLVDLHWHFFSALAIRNAFKLDIRRVFDHAKTVNLGGVTVNTLDPVDTTIFLATHAVLSGGHRLKWLYDFHCASSQLGEELTQVMPRARTYNVALPVAVMSSRTFQSLRTIPTRAAGSDVGGVSPWKLFCDIAGRTAPPESDYLDNYTARAVFSATRPTTRASAGQLFRNAKLFAQSGRSRRSAVVDRTILHDPGGSGIDRTAWLEMIQTFG